MDKDGSWPIIHAINLSGSSDIHRVVVRLWIGAVLPLARSFRGDADKQQVLRLRSTSFRFAQDDKFFGETGITSGMEICGVCSVSFAR